MRQHGTGISVEDLFNQISNQVHKEFERQTPMLMGETERTFFGGQSVGASRKVPVMKVDINKNRVQLQMGQASGITKGAEFDIFTFRTRDFQNSENRIMRVKVVEVGAADCWAEVIEIPGLRSLNPKLVEVAEGTIEIGSPAVYVSPGLKQIRNVRVILPDPLPQFPGVNIALLPTILEQMKTQVEGHRWIEFCSDEEKNENSMTQHQHVIKKDGLYVHKPSFYLPRGTEPAPLLHSHFLIPLPVSTLFTFIMGLPT